MLHLPGRFSWGTQPEMMIMAPFMIPEPPSPAIARPTISMIEDVAAPHKTDPNSKMAKKNKKDHCSTINSRL
jgi:hypothetical protein